MSYEKRVRADGLEPSTSGLRVRCSTIELRPRLGNKTSSIFSESGATRTPDLRVRSPALYPTELRTLDAGAVDSGPAPGLSRAMRDGRRSRRRSVDMFGVRDGSRTPNSST